jgi:hypothetical protein
LKLEVKVLNTLQISYGKECVRVIATASAYLIAL